VNDTKWPDLVKLRKVARDAEGAFDYAAWESDNPEPGQEEAYLHIANFNPTVCIALLDRIEELERENRGLEKQIEDWTEYT